MIQRISLIAILLLLLNQAGQAQDTDSVYFTTGFKIGELSDHSVVIWTRLCAWDSPVPVHHERKGAPMRSPLEFNDNIPVGEMDGAVKGTMGQVRIQLSAGSDIIASDWEYVSAYKDFTHKLKLGRLWVDSRHLKFIKIFL